MYTYEASRMLSREGDKVRYSLYCNSLESFASSLFVSPSLSSACTARFLLLMDGTCRLPQLNVLKQRVCKYVKYATLVKCFSNFLTCSIYKKFIVFANLVAPSFISQNSFGQSYKVHLTFLTNQPKAIYLIRFKKKKRVACKSIKKKKIEILLRIMPGVRRFIQSKIIIEHNLTTQIHYQYYA